LINPTDQEPDLEKLLGLKKVKSRQILNAMTPVPDSKINTFEKSTILPKIIKEQMQDD
jgi:hypothetical protein